MKKTFKKISQFLMLTTLHGMLSLSVYAEVEHYFPTAAYTTLEELDNWLSYTYSSGLPDDVVIKFTAGVYQDSVSWNFFDEKHSITFTSAEDDAPAIFNGCVNGGCISAQGNGFFFRFDPGKNGQSGKAGNLYFKNLMIENYTNGIYAQNTQNIQFENVYFENIGTISTFDFVPDGTKKNGKAYTGYSAILIKNSKEISVINSRFDRILNYAWPLPMHAIYFTNVSHSIVDGNTISDVSGDAIKYRDNSYLGTVTNNVISNSGSAIVQAMMATGDTCIPTHIVAYDNYHGLRFDYGRYADTVTGDWSVKSYLQPGLAAPIKLYGDPLNMTREDCFANPEKNNLLHYINSNGAVYDLDVLSESHDVHPDVVRNKVQHRLELDRGEYITFNIKMFEEESLSRYFMHGATNEERLARNVEFNTIKPREFKLTVDATTGNYADTILLTAGGMVDEPIVIPPSTTRTRYVLNKSFVLSDDFDSSIKIESKNNGHRIYGVNLVEVDTLEYCQPFNIECHSSHVQHLQLDNPDDEVFALVEEEGIKYINTLVTVSDSQPDENRGVLTVNYTILNRGEYEVEALVKTEGSRSDSVYISFNNDLKSTWHLGSPHTEFTWVKGQTVDLSQGINKMTILSREANTKIAAIRLVKTTGEEPRF